jgi:putative NADH-flavin reductase
MKKVIVFGATGTIGQHLFRQGLDNNQKVRAFVRNPKKLQVRNHENLDIVIGNVLDYDEVRNAIKGHDAVMITLGSGKSRTSTIRSLGTQIIIKAMQDLGVNRLLCQSTLGTYESNANLNFFWKRIMFGWYLKKIFLDHELQELLVMRSHLAWTIIRPAAFTDGEQTGLYKHGFKSTEKNLSLKISRADVADFMWKQVESNQYQKQTPGLSY